MGRSNDVLAPSPPFSLALDVLSDPVFPVPWDFDLSRFKFRPHPQHRLPFLLIHTPQHHNHNIFLPQWYPLVPILHKVLDLSEVFNIQLHLISLASISTLNNSIPPTHLRALINMAAVNRKTDVQQKEADVNQKLQLYGIYSGMASPFKAEISIIMANLLPWIAFANGKVPSVSFLKWLSCNVYHQVAHIWLSRTNKSTSPSTLP